MTKITKNIDLVVEELNNGKPVALPTETVYGLAANALNPDAVLNVFKVKKRPHFDPLIVHISDISEISKYARNIPDDVYKLAEKFSPGPVTFVINKKIKIPDLVTSGLKTVAVRIPSHRLFIKVLKHLSFPLAAPSANMFGRLSPTTAGEVVKELNGKINYVLDGGKCKIGIESTVIGFTDKKVRILRPGFITISQIEKVIGKKISNKPYSAKFSSPGQLKNHYAPRTPLYITDGNIDRDLLKSNNAGMFDFSKFVSLNILAANLFSELRKLDEKNYNFIVTKKLENDGIGYAVNDRLRKASSGILEFKKGKIIIQHK